MVRLKLLSTNLSDFEKLEFQFHYGAIKTRSLLSLPPLHQSFQFHYGAIKTKREFIYPCEYLWFQFHYGAIKTNKII